MCIKARHLTSASQGFSLIELLVVVAIIALLVGVLMPQLARARRQAREVTCRANLSQWGTIWAMYCQTNKDGFSEGMIGAGGDWHRGEWITCLRSQYYTKMNILRCPLATARRPANKEHGGPFHTYYMPTGGNKTRGGGEEPSYGVNSWIYNPLPGVTVIQGRSTVNNWRHPNQAKFPHRVPVFADTMWRGGGPTEDGKKGDPPAFDGEWISADYEMRHFCINRHNGYVNHLFMDWSVRRVALKELWTLKWHRNFNVRGRWTRAGGCVPNDWPAWMRNLPDH